MRTANQDWKTVVKTKTETVAICIITFRRPEGLKRLLEGINRLTFERNEPPELKIVVVDNDAAGAAGRVCDRIKPNFKYPLIFSIEPRRGISYARNRAIACVPPHTDFVVFIDDDEVPETTWLDQLLTVQNQYNADVVSGPVLPYFASDVATWVIKGRFFERPRYPTGHQRDSCATNNVLVRGEIFRSMDKLFDERFALTGGEDGHFFRRVNQAGYKIIWSDEALVYECVPESRTNIKWLTRRTYRTHSTFSVIEQEFDSSIKTQLIAAVKASVKIVLGILLLLPSLLFGKHLLVKALLNICGGAGRFSGLMGITYQEYKTIHGS